MSDEFINTVPQKFPNTLNHKESIERPWDVTENNLISPQEKTGGELKRDDLTDRIHTLYNELRSSLTAPSALEVDLTKAHRMVEEVSRIKIEVENIIEMLETMEKYMKERIK